MKQLEIELLIIFKIERKLIANKKLNKTTDKTSDKLIIKNSTDEEKNKLIIKKTNDIKAKKLEYEKIKDELIIKNENIKKDKSVKNQTTDEMKMKPEVRKKLLEIAKAHGVKIALSLSDPAMVQYAREGLEELMDDGVDLLFCNEQEALMYTNTTTVEDALTQLRFKNHTVVLKCQSFTFNRKNFHLKRVFRATNCICKRYGFIIEKLKTPFWIIYPFYVLRLFRRFFHIMQLFLPNNI